MSSSPNCAAKSAKLGTFGLNIVIGRRFTGLSPVTRGRAAFPKACRCVAATNVPGWRSRLCRLDRFRVSSGDAERMGILVGDSTESVMVDCVGDSPFSSNFNCFWGSERDSGSFCTLNSAQIWCDFGIRNRGFVGAGVGYLLA